MSKTKITIATLSLLLIGTLSANAYQSNFSKLHKLKNLEEGTKPLKHELIVFPISFLVSGFELGGEIVAKEKRTIRFSAGYFISNTANSYNTFANNNDIRYKSMEGFRTEVQYRFYSRDFEAKDNFYLGFFGVFKSVSLTGERRIINPNGSVQNTPVSLESSALSLGLLLGYRVRLNELFSMDFHFGGGMTPTSIGNAEEAHINQVNPYKKSINVRAGMTFGIKI